MFVAATVTMSTSSSSSLSPTPTSLLCSGDPPLPAALCIDGSWVIRLPNSTIHDPTIDVPIVIIGNTSIGGNVTIQDPWGIPITVDGCIIILPNTSLNVTLPDPYDVPPEYYVINSTCVRALPPPLRFLHYQWHLFLLATPNAMRVDSRKLRERYDQPARLQGSQCAKQAAHRTR